MNTALKQQRLLNAIGIMIIGSLLVGLPSATQAGDEIAQPQPVANRMFLPIVAGIDGSAVLQVQKPMG